MKPVGLPIVDTFVKEFKQTKWIHFPWDIEYTFATPIKDGGRAAAGPRIGRIDKTDGRHAGGDCRRHAMDAVVDHD